MRYRAFISYCHRDEVVARRLHRRLERFRPPKGLKLADGARPVRLYPVYRDRDEMAASASLPATIKEALEDSEHLIVLCSPAAATSAWVNAEIRLFAEVASAEHIFPVIVDSDAPACFPPAMLELLDDPLAPDLREGMDGFNDGTLKLIAGLWGTPFSLLKNREVAWRRRRAQLNLLIAAFIGGLAVFAGLSAWRADEQRRLAEAEARIAEARSLASRARFALDRNPGETSVAAMVAVQSLALSDTPEAKEVLRDALELAPLGANEMPFPWRWPQVATSRDGMTAAFTSAFSYDEQPAYSEIVSLATDFTDRARFPFDGLAVPVFSSDGRWLAIAGRVRRLVIQKVETGEIAVEKPIASGTSVAFSPAGDALYATTQLGKILRWQVDQQGIDSLTTIPVPGSRLTLPELSVSANGDWLLRTTYGERSSMISVNNAAVKTIPFTKTFEMTGFIGHEPVGALIQADINHVLTYDNFNTGALWDAERMQKLWTFNDHNDHRRSLSRKEANAISADGTLFARGYVGASVVVRDMADGAILRGLDHGGDVWSVRFISGTNRLAVGGDAGVSIWDIGQEDAPVRCAVDADVISMEVEAGKRSLLLGTDDGRLIRCDSATGEKLAERRFRGPITSIATSPNGVAIAQQLSATEDNWTEITFTHINTGKTVNKSINEPFDQVKLSADGARAATRSWLRGDVAIWDTASGEIVSRVTARGDVEGFTPDGERLLMHGRSLTVFDVASGKRIANLGEPAGVWSISSNVDNTLLITTGETESGEEHWGWDAQTGEQLWRISEAAAIAHGGDVYAINDKQSERLIVMNRASEQKIGWIPFPGDVYNVTLSPSGERLIAIRRTLDVEQRTAYEAEFWDVQGRTRLWKRQLSGEEGPAQFASLSAERAVFIGRARVKDQSTTQLEMLDWTTGEQVDEQAWPGSTFPSWLVDSERQELFLRIGKEISLLDMHTGLKHWSVTDEFEQGMALTPDGAHVIAVRSISNGRQALAVLDRSNGVKIREWAVDGQVQDIAATSDSELVLAALRHDDWNGIKAWRIDNEALAHELEMDAAPDMLVPLEMQYELIVRDFEGSVRAFDLRDGHLRRRFPMSIRADAGVFSADGKRAYTVAGSRLRLWDTESGVELASLAAKGEVATFAVSNDAREIAFATSRARPARDGAMSRVVEIWRPESGEAIVTLPAVDPRHITYDPSDSVIVIQSGNETVRVIDASTLTPRYTLRPLANGSWFNIGNTLTFSLDGAYLAVIETANYSQGNTSDRRAALRVFETVSGTEIARFDIGPSGISTTDAGFIYLDKMGRPRKFDIGVETLDQIVDVNSTYTLRPVPDSEQLLLSSVWDGDALIDITTGERIELTDRKDDELTRDSAVDASGRYVAILRQYSQAGERRSKIHVFDARTGDALTTLHNNDNHELGNIEFARSGDTIVVSQVPENVVISDMRKGGALFTWNWRDGSLQPLITDNLVMGFAVSADGETLRTSEGQQVQGSNELLGRLQTRLVRLADSSVGASLPKSPETPKVVVSADGNRFGLFSYGSPTSGWIYNADGERLLEISLQDAAFYAELLGFLHGGELFALGERSGARIFNLSTGTARRLRVPGQAKRYALSSDKAIIAIGGDEFVSIWDLATFERVADIQVTGLRQLAFAGADARALMAVTAQGVVRLEWNQTVLIRTACETYRNDDWETGRRRITGTEAPGLCLEHP